MFHYIENVLSDSILRDLAPLCQRLDTDKSSYDAWPSESTLNNTLPECFTTDLDSSLRIKIIEHLYQNPILRHRLLKKANFAIQKVPSGASIPEHSDSCYMSLTVFLSEVESGGEFISGSLFIKPKYNCGVYAKYSEHTVGPKHKVNEVLGTKTRYTLQMFLWDNLKNTDNSAKF